MPQKTLKTYGERSKNKLWGIYKQLHNYDPQVAYQQYLSNHLEPPLNSHSPKSPMDTSTDVIHTLPLPIHTPEAKRQCLNEDEVNYKFMSFHIPFSPFAC